MLVSVRPNILRFLTIDDLPKFDVKLVFTSKMDQRRKLRICVIEDQEFGPLDRLRENGFDITVFPALRNPSDILPYPVIVCDLRGVYTEAKLQGAALLKRLADDYPDKYIVVYTAAAASSRMFIEAERIADEILMKRSTDTDQLITILDDIGGRAVKPVEVWQRVRASLVAKYIPARTLLYLEHFFVLSIRKGNKDLLLKGVQETTQNDELRSVIISLISSALYAGIKYTAGALL